MKVLVVHNPEIGTWPPVRNLVENLLNNGHKVVLITKDAHNGLKINNEGLTIHLLSSYKKKRYLQNIICFLKNEFKLKQLVKGYTNECDVLWTTTDSSVRALGKLVFRYRHVMELLELAEDMPYIRNFNFPKVNLKKYAQHAWKVVVPEYNRAHILKTWWNLEETPCILPNKPYRLESNIETSDIEKIIAKMDAESRKIVLYQGVFYKDRKLDAFAEAIDSLKDEYVFYIMGRDNSIRQELCRKYKNIEYIPFIPAPNHLLITKHADIGVLPYIPQKVMHYSSLNALYCAPNKIYEYAAYGLPMIGSDVPGLMHPFTKYNIGVCCKKLTVQDVIKALNYVSEHYDEMKKNCSNFFSNTDLDEIVNNEILEGKK